MMKRLKDNRGITLIELLIAAAVLSLLAVGTVTVLSSGLRSYSENMESTQEQQSMRQAMIRITKLVRDPANTATVEGGDLKLNGTVVSDITDQLKWGSVVLAGDISIAAAYADAGHQVIQVDLSAGGATMSTKIWKEKKK